ncbi:ATP-binding protein, partial [Pseudomonas aeruginosa]
MKLEKLHLKNFRCFEELSLNFGKRLTVIIAGNGAGKTAILDAIAIGFGRYLTKLPGVKGIAVKDTDLRV